MQTFEFQGQTFQMESDAKLFLEKYLKRIDQYVKKNNIDPDIVDDIHQNILEKLFELKEPIKQKRLINIINNLGEPEDIFEGNEQINISSEKNIKKGRILGICSRLTEKTKLPVRIFRILLFAAIFFFTTGIRIYLILLIIKYAVEGKEKTESEIAPRVKNFFRGLWRCITGICKLIWNIMLRTCTLIKTLIIRTRNFIKAFFTKYLRKIFSRCCRIFIIFGLLSAIIGLCFVLAVRFGDLTIANQSFKILFSSNISIPLMALLAVCIFWIITVFSTFSKQPIKNRYLHLGVGIIAIASGIWLASSCTHFINYQEIKLTKETIFQPTNSKDIIEIQKLNNPEVNMYNGIQILPADEFKIETTIESSIFNKNHKQIIEDAFISPEIKEVNKNTYTIGRPDNELFSKKVPFNNPEIIIQIYAPKDAKIKILNTWCHNSFYRYEASENGFVCDQDFSERKRLENLEEIFTKNNQKIIQQIIEEIQTFGDSIEPEIQNEISREIKNCIQRNNQYKDEEIHKICQNELNKSIENNKNIKNENIQEQSEIDIEYYDQYIPENTGLTNITECSEEGECYNITITRERVSQDSPLDYNIITECDENGECTEYYE